MSSNAIQTSFFRDHACARGLFKTGIEYGGLFFRGVLAGYIEVVPRRNATAAICNLDGNATMNTVNCIAMAFSAGRQCRKAA